MQPYLCRVPVSAEGTTVLRFFSADVAGNQEATQTTNVLVDHTPPATGSNVDGGWHAGSQSITLSPSDALSGTKATNYRVGNSTWTTYTIPFTVSTEGRRMSAGIPPTRRATPKRR